MLWHPTDMEGQTRANAMSLFKPNEDGSGYFVEINKSKQFLLATRFVGRGMSFAMAADAIHDAKDVCDISKLGVCNDFLVASYARVACAISIEHISQALSSKWAFSVAFDASTDLQQTSWVDVRVRYYQSSGLENLHLKNLVEEMQAICPNLSATRWASMSRVARFLVEKRAEIATYFAEIDSPDRWDQLPTPAFWILISVVSEISSHVSECVEGLQGCRVTLQQQAAAVQSLLNSLQRFALVEVIPDDTMPPAHDVVVMGEIQVSHVDLTGFIQDQGIFASQTLAELQPEECTKVLQAVGEILLSIVNGLSSVEALRDEVNDASSDGIPPCLPHELLALKTR
ncbi:unnamed protein product, partial [Sphagnum troendelagicum]